MPVYVASCSSRPSQVGEVWFTSVTGSVFGKHAHHKLYMLSMIRLNEALANSGITITQPQHDIHGHADSTVQYAPD